MLYAEGYTDVDPIHPLGGPHGTKDAKALRQGERWITAAYFPRGQQTFTEIRKKFVSDYQGRPSGS